LRRSVPASSTGTSTTRCTRLGWHKVGAPLGLPVIPSGATRPSAAHLLRVVCHPERSEGSRAAATTPLRDPSTLPGPAGAGPGTAQDDIGSRGGPGLL